MGVCLAAGVFLVAASIGAAPSTGPAGPEIAVEGWGFTVEGLDEDARAFANRTYVWKDVPTAIRGWRYTRTSGGIRASVTVRSARDAVVHIATAKAQAGADLSGWEEVADLRFAYTDRARTVMQVYRRRVRAGESVSVPQGNWSGILVLARELAARAGAGKVPGTVVFHSPAKSGLYVGSPGIAMLPDGAYLAKCDQFGPKSAEFARAVTLVFRSEDKGRSWRPSARVEGMFWSNVFVHRGLTWMIGTDRHHGQIVIVRSGDGGRTWTVPADANTGLLTDGGQYHTAPMPMVEHAGRLWRGVEDASGGLRWGHRYRAMVMSAPLNADLLRRDSWTFSNAIPRDPNWLGGAFGGWLEGNAVAAPDGRIVNILRVDCPKGNTAAVVDISADAKTASFDAARGFIAFPGGAKKFTIRRDAASGWYWSLVNYAPPISAGPHAAGTRNTLALVSSADLRSWTVHCILLHHPDRSRHGFQYPDWLFDGEDIIAAIRTAYDDGQGGAHNAHDANYLTFHRFGSFRKLTLADSAVDVATLGMTSK